MLVGQTSSALKGISSSGSYPADSPLQRPRLDIIDQVLDPLSHCRQTLTYWVTWLHLGDHFPRLLKALVESSRESDGQGKDQSFILFPPFVSESNLFNGSLDFRWSVLEIFQKNLPEKCVDTAVTVNHSWIKINVNGRFLFFKRQIISAHWFPPDSLG